LKIRFRPDLSFQIRLNPAPAGLENKSHTALVHSDFIYFAVCVVLVVTVHCVQLSVFTYS